MSIDSHRATRRRILLRGTPSRDVIEWRVRTFRQGVPPARLTKMFPGLIPRRHFAGTAGETCQPNLSNGGSHGEKA